MFSFVHVIFYSLSTCMFIFYIFTITWVTLYSLYFHLIVYHENFSILQKIFLTLSFLPYPHPLKVINSNMQPDVQPPQPSPSSHIYKYRHICREAKMVGFTKMEAFYLYICFSFKHTKHICLKFNIQTSWRVDTTYQIM